MIEENEEYIGKEIAEESIKELEEKKEENYHQCASEHSYKGSQGRRKA